MNPRGLALNLEIIGRRRLGDVETGGGFGLGAGGAFILGPAFTRLAPSLELRIPFARFRAGYDFTWHLPGFDQLSSFASPEGDFSPQNLERLAMGDQEDDRAAGYRTTGDQLRLEADIELPIPIAGDHGLRFDLHMRIRRVRARLKNGDDYYYDLEADTLLQDGGWVGRVDALAAYTLGPWQIGARYQWTRPSPRQSSTGPFDRLGPHFAYRAPGDGRLIGPDIGISVQWHLRHRWRTGADIARAFPHLGFVLGLRGDLLVRPRETIPEGRYGVDSLAMRGVDGSLERALRTCLATAPRSRFTINPPDLSCGEAPFRNRQIQIPLWRWPWTEWPLYDRNVFERDLERIERWYRARGYYQARVEGTRLDPEAARTNDRVEATTGGELPCEPEAPGEGCTLDIEITIQRGEAVRVEALQLDAHGPGGAPVSAELEEALREALITKVGSRFDEERHDSSKAAMRAELRRRGFGCASVSGDVEIDPEALAASVAYRVETGPPCHIGRIEVTGNEGPSETVIRSVANIDPGDPFRQSDLAEAQHQIYALGAFASVDVASRPERDGEGACTGIVDVVIRVTPGRLFRYGLGGGVEAGSTQIAGIQTEDPQGNLHGLFFLEHRNFIGGLRRARLEVRPKLLFTLPGFGNPGYGADGRAELLQPAFIERRTTGFVDLRNDFGPDPTVTDGLLLRNVFDIALGARRTWFDGRLSSLLALRFNFYRNYRTVEPENRRDYRVFFIENSVKLDLRDDSRNPRLGAFFALESHVATLLSWDYVRLVPDARVYVPLRKVVLAARFRLGYMEILRVRDDNLDPASALLGPTPFRLRSGGPSSHRGFIAGFLGDDDPSPLLTENSGGLRRWEASLELRRQLTESLGVVLFADVGDVNRAKRWRFDHPRLAVGGGIRIRTPVGNIRADHGWLVEAAQVANACELGESPASNGCNPQPSPRFRTLFGVGAFHISIGEAF